MLMENLKTHSAIKSQQITVVEENMFNEIYMLEIKNSSIGDQCKNQ